jgi:hypothetical protein
MCSEQLYDTHSSLDIRLSNKGTRDRGGTCDTHGTEKKCTQGLVQKGEGRIAFGRIIIIRLDLKEIRWDGVS